MKSPLNKQQQPDIRPYSFVLDLKNNISSDKFIKSIVETFHENKENKENSEIRKIENSNTNICSTPKSTCSINTINSFSSTIQTNVDYLDFFGSIETNISEPYLNVKPFPYIDSSFSNALDETLQKLLSDPPPPPPPLLASLPDATYAPPQIKKRPREEFEENKKLGFSNIHDGEDKENYVYFEWDDPPVQHRRKYGVLTDERQKKLVEDLLQSWIKIEKNGPTSTSDHYQVKLLGAVKSCCSSNNWIESKKFIKNHCLFYNFLPGCENQNRRHQDGNRAYNDHRVFSDPKLPFVTRSRSQCLDSRFEKQAAESRRWKKRELRVNPVYVQTYREIMKKT